MRNTKWIALLVGLLACGLIAAGCGGDDDSSTSSSSTEATTSTDTASTTEDTSSTTEDTASTTEDTTSTDASGGATPDDVYNACIDVIEGTPAEATAKSSCEQARTAFEQCQKSAEAAGDGSATAMGICQDAADQAIKTLEAAG